MSCSRLFDSLRCLYEIKCKVDSFQHNRSDWVNDDLANLSGL